MIFTIHPHRNVLCTHKTTIEFTTDSELTLRGDCILGVNADFDLKELKKIKGKFKVAITCGKLKDSFIAYSVNSFNSDHELVIRKTSFISPRTFGIKSNKSSSEINRDLVNLLRKHAGTVKIEKIKIKALIFDLDETLATWADAKSKGLEAMTSKVCELYKINGLRAQDFINAFHKIEHDQLASSKYPEDHSRELWSRKALQLLGITCKKSDSLELERIFHDETLKYVELFSDTEKVLRELKKTYKIAIFSDSDGKKHFKINRIERLGLDRISDLIVTSDDTGYTKPHVINFLHTAEQLKLKPEECAMIGDWPERDLITAKDLGMTTILIKNGNGKSMKDYKYVDFEIESIKDLHKILKEI